eukprot:1224627-Ditylum_brightwellii.AAC.1
MEEDWYGGESICHKVPEGKKNDDDTEGLNYFYNEDHCYACSNCRQRKINGANGEGYDDHEAHAYNVDCNECRKECKKLNQGGLSNEVNDLDCQEAYEDEDEGLQI